MQTDLDVLQRQFSYLQDYNISIQQEIKRKNEEIRILEMEIQRLSSSKYTQSKSCKNCLMYQSEIISLKDQLQNMKKLTSNQINRDLFAHRQRLASESTNTKTSRYYPPESPKQNHQLELELIQIKGKLQKVITENAQLKRMIHQKNLQLIRFQNNQINKSANQEQQRIAHEQYLTLEFMQNRIIELENLLQNKQKNSSTIQTYERQNKLLAQQVSQAQQILNQYADKIDQLQKQIKRFSHVSARNNSQEQFVHMQLLKANQQKMALNIQINQLNLQNRENIEKNQSLLRRISILQDVNRSLQAQLRNSITKNNYHNPSSSQQDDIKHSLKNLQNQVEFLKKYMINSVQPIYLHHGREIQNCYSFSNHSRKNSNANLNKHSYPLTVTNLKSFNKVKRFEDIKLTERSGKQKRSITMEPVRDHQTYLKLQQLQKKIGQLKNENHNIKNDLTKHK